MASPTGRNTQIPEIQKQFVQALFHHPETISGFIKDNFTLHSVTSSGHTYVLKGEHGGKEKGVLTAREIIAKIGNGVADKGPCVEQLPSVLNALKDINKDVRLSRKNLFSRLKPFDKEVLEGIAQMKDPAIIKQAIKKLLQERLFSTFLADRLNESVHGSRKEQYQLLHQCLSVCDYDKEVVQELLKLLPQDQFFIDDVFEGLSDCLGRDVGENLTRLRSVFAVVITEFEERADQCKAKTEFYSKSEIWIDIWTAMGRIGDAAVRKDTVQDFLKKHLFTIVFKDRLSEVHQGTLKEKYQLLHLCLSACDYDQEVTSKLFEMLPRDVDFIEDVFKGLSSWLDRSDPKLQRLKNARPYLKNLEEETRPEQLRCYREALNVGMIIHSKDKISLNSRHQRIIDALATNGASKPTLNSASEFVMYENYGRLQKEGVDEVDRVLYAKKILDELPADRSKDTLLHAFMRKAVDSLEFNDQLAACITKDIHAFLDKFNGPSLKLKEGDLKQLEKTFALAMEYPVLPEDMQKLGAFYQRLAASEKDVDKKAVLIQHADDCAKKSKELRLILSFAKLEALFPSLTKDNKDGNREVLAELIFMINYMPLDKLNRGIIETLYAVFKLINENCPGMIENNKLAKMTAFRLACIKLVILGGAAEEELMKLLRAPVHEATSKFVKLKCFPDIKDTIEEMLKELGWAEPSFSIHQRRERLKADLLESHNLPDSKVVHKCEQLLASWSTSRISYGGSEDLDHDIKWIETLLIKKEIYAKVKGLHEYWKKTGTDPVTVDTSVDKSIPEEFRKFVNQEFILYYVNLPEKTPLKTGDIKRLEKVFTFLKDNGGTPKEFAALKSIVNKIPESHLSPMDKIKVQQLKDQLEKS